MNGADDEAVPDAFEEKGATEDHSEKDDAKAGDDQSDGNSAGSDDFDEDSSLHGLVQRTKDNPGAPFEAKALAALLYLRRDNRSAFEKIFGELKPYCRTHELEKTLKENEAGPTRKGERSGGKQGNGESVSAQGDRGGLEVTALIKSVEPWPVPVDVAMLTGRMAVTLRRYIIMTKDQALACAVWSIFTHCIDALDYSPRLRITAPARRCGKTNLLTLVGYLSRRYLMATGVTAAPLFRTIAACNPTLLIDEFDKIRKDDVDIHAILNAGITRETHARQPDKVGIWPSRHARRLLRLQLSLQVDRDRAVQKLRPDAANTIVGHRAEDGKGGRRMVIADAAKHKAALVEHRQQ